MLCPICKKPVEETTPKPGERSPFPFCSERCRLIDLGRWLGEKYQIPTRTDQHETDDSSSQRDAPR